MISTSRSAAGNCSALLVLGLSLATKHVLFAFPFWLAVKQKGLGQKVIVVLVPVLVFLSGFAPYWHEGSQGSSRTCFNINPPTTNFLPDVCPGGTATNVRQPDDLVSAADCFRLCLPENERA